MQRFVLSSFGKKWRSRHFPILLFGIILTTCVAFFAFFRPGILDSVNSRVYDIFLRSLPSPQASSLPVIVDIDDQSLNRYGQWPWPRYRVARLLRCIERLNPRSVALDILFPEPDRTSLEYLNRQIGKELNIHLDLSAIPQGLRDNDAVLARTLASGPFVLGYKFSFDSAGRSSLPCCLKPAQIFVVRSKDAPSQKIPLLHPLYVICNLPRLARSVRYSGFLNAIADRDGVVRRVPLLMAYRGRIYPSLALAAMMQAFDVHQMVLRVGGNGEESLQFGHRRIPLDEQGNLLIRFRRLGETFPRVSATAVLEGKVERKEIEGHIVFVGTLAAGLNDFHATPLDPVYPGTEVHAAIVDNIVQGDFLRRPVWVRGIELLVGVLIGVFAIVLLTYGRPVWSIPVIGLSAGGLWFASKWMLANQGIFISPVVPFMMLVVNFSFLSALKFWREERIGRKRAKELADVQALTLETIVMVIETRHLETGGHVKRTQLYVKHLAQSMQKNEKYRKILDKDTVDLLYRSSPLHDVGKVGVPDSVLKKPGRLDREEFEIMKRHTIYGKMIFDLAEEKLGHNSFLSIARTIAYTHHEKWDGSGYPQGLKGEEIPLFGRIMAVADIYDALVSRRVYKQPLSHDKAAAIIMEKSGKDFDPDVVKAFLSVQKEFQEVAKRFADGMKSRIDLIATSFAASGKAFPPEEINLTGSNE